ncbi:mannose/fructose/sorbose PTS transporter subunit IIA [Streptobacillus moniliformis]|uniref:mannose/fructose/sorbose PTS transporter subunit IIA n=1 Tax=Streptobacillus moniliformis TaxID=34105 RepID=UPI0007E3B2C4|nr:mannose/fructose/sorbose PTS transporter subunit IIA [Streptobacillus moniliformis]
MIGIIIASHGNLASGILETSKMILGDVENLVAVGIYPNEGPEDLKNKIVEAAKSFDNQNEVLVLVDIWSGSPFNQANALMAEYPNWAIVTGVNLPLLAEAIDVRDDVTTAHELASKILNEGREGIKVKPEELEPKKVRKQVANLNTNLGDGKIEYVLARVDTRLLHGQVATSWTKATRPDRIIVVSDAVSKDALRKTMITEAAPPGVKANTVPIDKMVEVDKDPRFGNTKALLLFETPQDALKAIEKGMKIDELNIGSMAHSVGKVAVTTSLAMDMEDVKTFEKLLGLGVKMDVRKVPADTPGNIEQILNKVREKF